MHTNEHGNQMKSTLKIRLKHFAILDLHETLI